MAILPYFSNCVFASQKVLQLHPARKKCLKIQNLCSIFFVLKKVLEFTKIRKDDMKLFNFLSESTFI